MLFIKGDSANHGRLPRPSAVNSISLEMKLQRLPQNGGESINQAITRLNQNLRYLPRISYVMTIVQQSVQWISDWAHSRSPRNSIEDSLKMYSRSHFYVSHDSEEAHILFPPSIRSRCRGMQFWG